MLQSIGLFLVEAQLPAGIRPARMCFDALSCLGSWGDLMGQRSTALVQRKYSNPAACDCDKSESCLCLLQPRNVPRPEHLYPPGKGQNSSCRAHPVFPATPQPISAHRCVKHQEMVLFWSIFVLYWVLKLLLRLHTPMPSTALVMHG